MQATPQDPPDLNRPLTPRGVFAKLFLLHNFATCLVPHKRPWPNVDAFSQLKAEKDDPGLNPAQDLNIDRLRLEIVSCYSNSRAPGGLPLKILNPVRRSST